MITQILTSTFFHATICSVVINLSCPACQSPGLLIGNAVKHVKVINISIIVKMIFVVTVLCPE